MRTGRNPWLTAFALLIYAFLFAPIVILIIFSFNVSRRNFVWLGFTTGRDWPYGSALGFMLMVITLAGTLFAIRALRQETLG